MRTEGSRDVSRVSPHGLVRTRPLSRRHTLHHLACVLHPRERGLTPSRVVYRRAESPPVPSMRDDECWDTHPERDETAIVWAQDEASIAEAVTDPSPRSRSHLRVLTI